MVSAWASKNGITLGQVKTEEKSNEITAIPELLELLEIKGCIVTIDAMGCQKKIAANIVDKYADYVLALKGNQGTLNDDVTLENFHQHRFIVCYAHPGVDTKCDLPYSFSPESKLLAPAAEASQRLMETLPADDVFQIHILRSFDFVNGTCFANGGE